MLGLLIPSLFLYIFGFFNILGINRGLVLNYVIFLFVGIVLFLIGRRIGLRFFKINSSILYLVFVGILIVTYIIGFEARGSKRWIDLYVFNFQPSEFFKIIFIIYFARQFSHFLRRDLGLGKFFLLVLHFVVPVFIVFKQPDLGSAMVYVFVFAVLVLFSSVPKRYVVFLAIIVSMVLPLGIYSLKDYQKARIFSFLNPHIDQQGSSYNMTQAIITIGSGGLLGRGLGLGTQSQLLFLPENHTDFAYSSLVEQFGFIGGFMVIVLYALVCFTLARSVIRYYPQKNQEESFKFLVVLGFLSMFAFQAFINIGMNLGMLPITGITLPLISYGGSSIVTLLFGMALLPL